MNRMVYRYDGLGNKYSKCEISNSKTKCFNRFFFRSMYIRVSTLFFNTFVEFESVLIDLLFTRQIYTQYSSSYLVTGNVA